VAALARRSRKGGVSGWIGLGGHLWALRRCPRGRMCPAKANVLWLPHEKLDQRPRGVEGAVPGWALYLLQTSTPAWRAHLPR
jgi:hypothetical protein